VSRWSVNGARLRVELRPQTITVCNRTSFPRARLLDPEHIAVDTSLVGPHSEPWRASLETFGASLRESRRTGVRLEVVLSGHFVRYALIPWSEDLVGDDERMAFAKLAFRDIYGAAADGWDLCLDEQPSGQRSFACAVDRALMVGLRDAATSVGGRLISVAPALADCINRHRRIFSNKGFCLAHAEAGRVTLAFHSRNGWQAVRGRRLDDELADALPVFIKQEASAAAVPELGILYVCPGPAYEVGALSIPGWKVVRLGEDASATLQPSDASFAVAES